MNYIVVCRYILIAFLFVPTIFAFNCLPQSASDWRKEWEVYGTVRDRQDAVVTGAEVVFTKTGLIKSAKTDDRGNYTVMLPSGIYEVSFRLGLSSPVFKRAKVTVADRLQLNFVLLPWCLSGCSGSLYSFSTFSAGWVPKEYLNLVIVSISKKKSGASKVTYRDAILTFDYYTISSEKIIQDFKSKKITAEGTVWIEDGKSRRNFDKVTMKITKDGLKIDGR